MADDQTAFAYENPALAPIRRRESGSQNIANRQGPGGTPASTASGYYQIVDSTWNEGLKLAGIDPSQYPSAMSAPAIVQVTVANALHDKYGDRPWAASSTMDQLGGGYNADMVNRTMGDIGGLFRQQQAAQAPILADMQQRFKQDQIRFDKAAEDYTPIHETQAPPPPPTDPLKGFASVGAIFAAIASGFTHTPAINAMNGMAAAINATKRNDWEQYEAGYRQWKDNTEIAIQHHKLQAEDMRNAMEMMTTNLAAGTAMAHAVAAQTQDEIAMKLLSLGKYEELAKLQESREKTASEIQARSKEVEVRDEQLRKMRREGAAASDLADAIKTGDQSKIDQALTNYGMVSDPVGSIARIDQSRARSLASDPNSYDPQTGKMTPDAERAIMAVDPKLALDIKRSETEKQLVPKSYTFPDGSIKMARMLSTGQAVDMAGNPIDLSQARPTQASDINQVVYSDSAMDKLVDQFIASGGKDKPSFPWGPSGNKARAQFAERSAQKMDSYNISGADLPGMGAVLGANRQALVALVKQNAAISAYSDTAVQNGKVLIDLAEKVDTTGSPVIERWIRAGRQAVYGDVDVTMFNAQLRTYANEVAKIITNPSLTGVLTDEARREVTSFTPEGANLGQIKALTSLFEGDFSRRLGANESEIDKLTRAVRTPPGPLTTHDKPAIKGAALHPDIPSKLQGKPGLSWSESRQQWKDSSGKVYDLSGDEVH